MMISTIVGYRTYIENMELSKRFDEAVHAPGELELAMHRWRFLQHCADAEGCWVILERVEAQGSYINTGLEEVTDFRLVRTELLRITSFDPTRQQKDDCLDSDAGERRRRKEH